MAHYKKDTLKGNNNQKKNEDDKKIQRMHIYTQLAQDHNCCIIYAGAGLPLSFPYPLI